MLDPIRRARFSLVGLARRFGAGRRGLPTFIIAGTQKGGTSSLFALLGQHPQIIGPRSKELHYFDNQYERGVAWYRSNFPLASRLRARKAITGEASPYYMFHPLTPERIHDTLPNVRLIFVLRNPVDRAISHYFHAVHWRHESLPIEEAFASEIERLRGEESRLRMNPTYCSPAHQHHSYVSRGLYAVQLERFFERFPKEQILVLASEELYRAPQEILGRVFAHIGVGVDHVAHDLEPKNVGSYSGEVPEELRARLIETFEPENQRLYRLLGTELGW